MIAAVLERFAAWALRAHPTPGSSSGDPVKFGAYAIKDADGDPYMTRIMFPRVFGRRVMLHHIHRPDEDRELHNHPWAALSLILSGSYDEERLCSHGHGCERHETRRVRWFNRIGVNTFHRIVELHGDVWTLFVSGPRTQEWGFREWDLGYEAWTVTPWREYIEGRRFERDDHGYHTTPPDIEIATGATLAKERAR